MKTAKVIFQSIFFVLLASVAYGQEGEGFFSSITESENLKAVVIQLDDLDGMRTHIHIMNHRGVTAYSDYVWGERKYAANFVMEGMPLGDYLVRIRNRRGEKVRAIRLTDQSLRLFNYTNLKRQNEVNYYSTAKKEGRLIARFSTEEGKPILGVQLANLKYRPATLFMVSLEGIPVMEKTLKGDYAYARQFNLTGLGEGKYYLYVSTPETSVWQVFEFEKGRVELKERFYRDGMAEETEETVVVAE